MADPRPAQVFQKRGRRSGAPRLLVVSYHFPPGQAAGALRWEKLSHFAAERGYELDVLTLDPADLESPDAGRLEALPAGIRVFGVPEPDLLLDRIEHWIWRRYRRLRNRTAPSPTRAAAAGDANGETSEERRRKRRPASLPREAIDWNPANPRTFLRAYYAWLQHARFGRWARAAAGLGHRLHEEEPYDAVVTCGPPHPVHQAGRLLARRRKIPFVMDMRDPWSLQQRLAEHVASPLWFRLARRRERRAVEESALVVCNTQPFRDRMRDAYPERHGDIIAVMNGYDEGPLPSSPPSDRFLIAYAGSIYIDRDPRLLFRAAGRVARELDLSPERFRIEFIGNVDSYGGVPIAEMAREEGIGEHVRTGPFRPREEAMRFLAGATMLVSLPQDSHLAIPSKVFEYMRFPAWILTLAERGSATERVLREGEADVVAPDDVAGIARAIRGRYLQFSRGEFPEPFATGGRFSRRAQAEILFDALESQLSD